jgi:hypothetical protein
VGKTGHSLAPSHGTSANAGPGGRKHERGRATTHEHAPKRTPTAAPPNIRLRYPDRLDELGAARSIGSTGNVDTAMPTRWVSSDEPLVTYDGPVGLDPKIHRYQWTGASVYGSRRVI